MSYHKLTESDRQRIQKLRYHDGLSSSAVADIIGCSAQSVKRLAPGYIGKVPNEKLRAAFERSDLSAVEVARRMGWWCSTGRGGPDSSRVKRTLGLLDTIDGRGIRSTRRLIDAEIAALMADAIGIVPWEVLPDDEQAAA